MTKNKKKTILDVLKQNPYFIISEEQADEEFHKNGNNFIDGTLRLDLDTEVLDDEDIVLQIQVTAIGRPPRRKSELIWEGGSAE